MNLTTFNALLPLSNMSVNSIDPYPIDWLQLSYFALKCQANYSADNSIVSLQTWQIRVPDKRCLNSKWAYIRVTKFNWDSCQFYDFWKPHTYKASFEKIWEDLR